MEILKVNKVKEFTASVSSTQFLWTEISCVCGKERPGGCTLYSMGRRQPHDGARGHQALSNVSWCLRAENRKIKVDFNYPRGD